MTDAPPTHDRGTAATEGPFAALAPAARTIVFDAVPPHDRSLPVALCTIAGTVGSAVTATSNSNSNSSSSDRRTVELLEPVTNAVAFLEGYVRIRSGLLESDRYADADRRDAAVLASDYLHAAAYESITTVPVSDRRALELYRVLTDGSSSLAAQFTRSVGAADETAPDTTASTRSHPNVALAGTAATLGATAVGAPADVRTAMATYARSLSGALLARTGSESETGAENGSGSGSQRGSGTPETSAADPRTTAVRVLSGRAAAGTETGTGAPAESQVETTDADGAVTAKSGADDTREPYDRPGRTGPDANTSSIDQIEHHLERARRALETLEELTVSAAVGDTHAVDRSPIERLERATRIPFHHEQ